MEEKLFAHYSAKVNRVLASGNRYSFEQLQQETMIDEADFSFVLDKMIKNGTVSRSLIDDVMTYYIYNERYY